MLHDIQSKDDIALLLNTFYNNVLDNNTIGFIFKNKSIFNLQTHLPIIESFWNSLLFGAAEYKGNPMQKHIILNKTIPLTGEHFETWLMIWEDTVNKLFVGRVATQAINQAKKIASVMQLKIKNNGQNIIEQKEHKA